jgi:MoxR-like ATPase
LVIRLWMKRRIVLAQDHGHPIDALQPVIEPQAILALREAVAGIHVAPDVRRYVIELVRATRAHDQIELGVSPRGSLALYHAAQAFALVHRRSL